MKALPGTPQQLIASAIPIETRTAMILKAIPKLRLIYAMAKLKAATNTPETKYSAIIGVAV